LSTIWQDGQLNWIDAMRSFAAEIWLVGLRRRTSFVVMLQYNINTEGNNKQAKTDGRNCQAADRHAPENAGCYGIAVAGGDQVS
jgi:hypothetical protein